MVRIGTPPDIENYMMANDDEALILHQAGFMPRWRDEGCIYFAKTVELLEFLKGGE